MSILKATIKQQDGQWCVFSEDGSKRLGCYDTEAEAEKRLAQVERFKSSLQRLRVRASLHADGEGLDERQRFPIVIMEAGLSKVQDGATRLPVFFPPEVVKAAIATGIFADVQSGINHPTLNEDEQRPEGDVRDISGVIENVRWDETVGELGAAVADWVGIDEQMLAKVRNAARAGVLEKAFEFSVNAGMQIAEEPGEHGGQPVALATAIGPAPGGPTRVDQVTKGAARGRFIDLTRLAASLRGNGGSRMSWKDFLTAGPALAAALMAASNDEAATELLKAFKLDLDGDAFAALSAEMLVARAEVATEKPAEGETTTTAKAEDGTATETKKAEDGAETETAKAEAGKKTETAKAENGVTTTTSPELDEKLAQIDAKTAALDEAGKAIDEKLAAAQTLLTNTAITSELSAAALDAETETDLLPQLQACAVPAERLVIISKRKAYLAKLTASDRVSFPASATRGVEITADRWDIFRAALTGFFRPRGDGSVEVAGRKVPRFDTFRACVANFPNRSKVYATNAWGSQTGEVSHQELRAAFASMNSWYANEMHGDGEAMVLRGSEMVPLKAAITTSQFGEIFADTAHREVLVHFAAPDMFDEFLSYASHQREYDDFDVHRLISVGGYADFPSVAEGQPYGTATTPGDVEETLQLVKYGRVETFTWESMLSPERSQSLASMPERLMSALRRTLRKAIVDFLTTNANLNQDATALFHANHGPNTLTTAFSIDALAAVRVAMEKQTEAGSSERLGEKNTPWALLIPIDLEDLVATALEPRGQFMQDVADAGANANLGPNLFRGRIKTTVVPHWTNTGDWYTFANPATANTFAVAFLRSVKAPQFFTQTSEESPSMFDSDQGKWKVRLPFDVAPVDYRGMHWNNV